MVNAKTKPITVIAVSNCILITFQVFVRSSDIDLSALLWVKEALSTPKFASLSTDPAPNNCKSEESSVRPSTVSQSFTP